MRGGYTKIRLNYIAIAAAMMISAMDTQAQSPASYGQQIAVMKMLKANLGTVGVLSSTISNKTMEDITRAAAGQGVKVVFARPKEAMEIAGYYKRLVGEKSVEVIWIPDVNDQLLLGIGFEFLKENTLPDKIGLYVPDQKFVSSGALCSVLSVSGKLTAYVNQKIARVVGVSVPSEEGSAVTYVSQ